MADPIDGITVTESFAVDWAKLGRSLAQQSPLAQAAFLDGFGLGMSELDPRAADMTSGGTWFTKAVAATKGRGPWLIGELAAALGALIEMEESRG